MIVQHLSLFAGDKLEGCTYRHPFGKELLPLLPGEHVTSEVGTGLVHTAPAHGHEDYLLALANNLSFVSEACNSINSWCCPMRGQVAATLAFDPSIQV